MREIFVQTFVSTGRILRSFPIKVFNKEDLPLEYSPNKGILIFFLYPYIIKYF